MRYKIITILQNFYVQLNYVLKGALQFPLNLKKAEHSYFVTVDLFPSPSK